MADLISKLGSVIGNLEKQSEEIDRFSGVLGQIEVLKGNLSELSASVTNDVQMHRDVLGDFKKNVDAINAFESKQEQYQREFAVKLSNELQSTYKKIEERISKTETITADQIKNLGKKMEATVAQIETTERKIVESMNSKFSVLVNELRVANHLCLECGKPVGFMKKLTGKQYCSEHSR